MQRKREGEGRKCIFWNIAGLGRQDKEFWKFIGNYDYICLNKTWMEEKNWFKLRGKLPGTHVWGFKEANRTKKKGRAKGGFITGLRKGWGKEGTLLLQDRGEGMVVTRIEDYSNSKKKDLIIVVVYNNDKWEAIEEGIKRVVEENRENLIIIGGDFNVRIGEEEGNNIEGWGNR